MKEIEAKILEIDRQKTEEILANLGANKIFEGEIETFFFDFKDGSIIKAKNVLRLRKEQNQIELTFKKVQITKTAKVAEEYSVEISNLETMKTILESLGLSVIEKMQKHRISYKLEQARFDIDRYLGDYSYIPEFLEIEAENPNSLHKYAAFLGFKAEDCLPWSTNELINYYVKRKKTE
jgi:adenylate cyclase, class 2